MTFADLASQADAHAEIVGGSLVYEAEPSAEPAGAQLALGAFLRQSFLRKPGSGGPGGCSVLTECDVVLFGEDPN